MENRKWARAAKASCAAASGPFATFCILFSVLLFSFLIAGCASPSEPYERRPPIPQAVSDLTATRSGNDVVLSFTLPNEAMDHRPLSAPLAFEIYRDFEPTPASGNATLQAPDNPTLRITVPASMAGRYSDQGRVRYADALSAEDFAQHAGNVAVYIVRTLASPKKSSANSNAAVISVQPAPQAIDDLKTDVTPSAIVITWTAPKALVDSTPIIAGYRIYRAEAPSTATTQNPLLKSPLAQIGETPPDSQSFRDSQFNFGATYAYSVRSFAQYPNGTLESTDSNLVILTPRDTFPPAAPQGLIVVPVPSQGNVPAHIELSWAISPETDLSGYNVYRTEQASVPPKRLNTELLLTPAFRDMNVLSGHVYSYTVTAVDSSGNESGSSAA
ncbi:MAG TPA: fibronectin type III domain-containing protein, partial [Verrucomicrobiae bacterium]|nr:fibronectin type III domain-containing protein [Verrucomicrobiae bacterium]